MAKLYFYYSTMQTLLLTAAFDDRYGQGKITSRIGLEAEASLFSDDTDLLELVTNTLKDRQIDCVMVDESQFLSRDQVFQLSEIADQLKIPVLCYGLRTDFQGNLFEGSRHLLAWADELKELKTICFCGSKATMVIRVDENGDPIREGAQKEVGGNDRYVALCRKHFKQYTYGD
jgi:thymidine kinase